MFVTIESCRNWVHGQPAGALPRLVRIGMRVGSGFTVVLIACLEMISFSTLFYLPQLISSERGSQCHGFCGALLVSFDGGDQIPGVCFNFIGKIFVGFIQLALLVLAVP